MVTVIECAVSRTHAAPLRSEAVQILPRLPYSKLATHACCANKFASERKSEIQFVKHQNVVVCASSVVHNIVLTVDG